MRIKQQLEQCRQQAKLLDELNYDNYLLDKLGDMRNAPRKRLLQERKKYSDMRERIRQEIRKIKYPRECYSDVQCVLLYRYVDNLGWGDICRKLNLSQSTCFKYQRRGIEEIEKQHKVRSQKEFKV